MLQIFYVLVVGKVERDKCKIIWIYSLTSAYGHLYFKDGSFDPRENRRRVHNISLYRRIVYEMIHIRTADVYEKNQGLTRNKSGR